MNVFLCICHVRDGDRYGSRDRDVNDANDRDAHDAPHDDVLIPFGDGRDCKNHEHADYDDRDDVLREVSRDYGCVRDENESSCGVHPHVRRYVGYSGCRDCRSGQKLK